MATAVSVAKKPFATENKQILSLVINALYQNKEVFLRELISNASDALDKFKMLQLKDDSLNDDEEDLKIWVLFDKDAKTITVKDNGVGMSLEEVDNNLGTIAKSGTKEFLANMAKEGAEADNGSLIGQFGVGFYSAFLVASKVEVRTRRAGLSEDKGVHWSSDGVESYEINEAPVASRGTEIIMHLKDDAKSFLEEWQLRKIITTYSDHLGYPIAMMVEREVPDTDAADDQGDEGEGGEKKAKPMRKEIKEEVVNQAKALWTLSKKDITDEQYESFYKSIGHDFNAPLTWTHNRVEGKLEYTSLLYVPSQAPFDLWNRDVKRGLKLYVQRVFIMDDAQQLLPVYLRFVKGLVDSNDLPLNVSREVLQNSDVVETIKTSCTKRTLSLLEHMASAEPEKYQKFWNTFGSVLKEGPAEDFNNRERIAKLLRFSSSHEDQSEQSVSLEDYMSRAQEGQDKIYYVVAETFQAAKNSPHLELFRKRGVEVLLLSDRVDEWMLSSLTEFQGKKLVSIARGDVDLGDMGVTEEEKAQVEQNKKDFEDIVKRIKSCLDKKVKEVRVTERLTDSASCVVADENEMSSNLRRMLKEAGQSVPETLPILEINPDHALVERLKDETSDERFDDIAQILLDQAVLAEGGSLENPADYVRRINALIQ